MQTRKIHLVAGLLITIFTSAHLINHAFAIEGPASHRDVMLTLRLFYRNPIAEALLLLAVLLQVVSGIRLFRARYRFARGFFEKLQLYSGLYLAVFLLIHLSAVLTGRFVLKLDTNLWFGVAGLNSFPHNLFFIPYYALAIVAFFGHIAALAHRRLERQIAGLDRAALSRLILVAGVLLMIFILFALTNRFTGFMIPDEYGILIGK